MENALSSIFEYLSHQSNDTGRKAWLILGKGPSFSKLSVYDLLQYSVLTLNDAVREYANVDIAHFIDFDAFERCADAAANHAKIVALPWFPHFDNKAGSACLADLVVSHQSLALLAAQGRLCWYDLDSSPVRHGNHPVVSARFFSAEAAFDLLATAGVKRIRSLGVDGGHSYGAEFSDLRDISCLSNSQKNFDLQFESFAKVLARTGVDYSPLDMESPIRVYVASTASEMLPVKVLEYSIKQHCSATVEVMALCDVDIQIPQPVASESRPRTPFSFQRFLIPQVSGFSGRAIYFDSDMLVFKDIRTLWGRPFDGAEVLAAHSDRASSRKPQFSVMLLDCSKLRWDINEIVTQLDSGVLTYEKLMYDFALAKTSAAIESDWNALETFRPHKTALLHYTDMNTQPWVSHLNPLGYLWVAMLRKAIRDGIVSREFVEEEIAKGHIRPSLMYQLDQGIDDAILLPASILALDAKFIPPYRGIADQGTSPWRNRLLWFRAAVRSNYQKTMFYKLECRIRDRLNR